jgi:putative PIN family toxin of toxin-antitoxin system
LNEQASEHATLKSGPRRRLSIAVCAQALRRSEILFVFHLRLVRGLTRNIACNILLGMKAYVLDTDVLVAAFRSDTGASRQVLEAARGRRFDLLLSVPLMLEYESVLTRPEHLAASGASREDVSAVLDELASVGKKVELLIRTRPMLLDPNDEMVLETAINGRADAIVTFNERDFRPAAARFRCSVVRPGKVILGLAEETE